MNTHALIQQRLYVFNFKLTHFSQTPMLFASAYPCLDYLGKENRRTTDGIRKARREMVFSFVLQPG